MNANTLYVAAILFSRSTLHRETLPCLPNSILDSAIDAAAARLGYEEVKPEQREAVRGLVNGRDVFVALPTGFGKSLCNAMLPLVFDSVRGLPPSTSIVLCVTQLVALMMDQKEKIYAQGS